ncbi:hypothetical protein [Rubellimicrobium roseum]|uniref:Uncharacterized protein n=1 Tax=Rubellimicrobium roseum TaxID=687525 RepID=A0A5C4NAJ1_9RHOB|nr:hypothetical protein [Rubellimicrobium roseum]TNC60673.1 hypothetical protein FHG71_21885 [Rubellimicrobium roseum]
MARRKALPKPQDFGFTTFAQIFSDRASIPGETPGSHESFHAAMMRTLMPFTPYEMVIAENLIAIEWELLQHRRMRDQSIRAAIQTAVCGAVVAKYKAAHKAEMKAALQEWCAAGNRAYDFSEEPFDQNAAAATGEDLAQRCIDPDLGVQTAAHAEIEKLGLHPLQLMGEAYREPGRSVTYHEEKIQELERRRRSVKEDYDRLQKVRPVEAQTDEVIEAEVLAS